MVYIGVQSGLKPNINLSFSKIQIANPDNFTWAIFFPTQVKLLEITQFLTSNDYISLISNPNWLKFLLVSKP